MSRWRLTVEYDGGPFVGWQRQANGLSVQEALETAIHAFCGETVTVHGAGRTDAGVHALGQVAHIDLARPTTARAVRDAINFHLRPHPVAVLEAESTADDFHARFSATGRAYLYRILNRRAPPALDTGRVWPVAAALNAEAMHEAAQFLIGRHDFSSFRAAGCQAESPLRTLDRLDVSRRGEEIHVTAEARSFLHNQVRIMVGTLRAVGEGSWNASDVAIALAACDRTAAGPTAPPDGLYLTRVDYTPR
ncbi:MAG: tRNA pseudouridine(38-40) synthase TruA [Alphaproteobacteria bacterium]